MYHTFNEGKAVIVERFNRTLKNIMFKYFTVNNTYIDSLDKMVRKYNDTIQCYIEMKPKDAVHSKYTIKIYNALYGNYKAIYPFFKFDIGDKVRIFKRTRTFEKRIHSKLG